MTIGAIQDFGDATVRVFFRIKRRNSVYHLIVTKITSSRQKWCLGCMYVSKQSGRDTAMNPGGKLAGKVCPLHGQRCRMKHATVDQCNVTCMRMYELQSSIAELSQIPEKCLPRQFANFVAVLPSDVALIKLNHHETSNMKSVLALTCLLATSTIAQLPPGVDINKLFPPRSKPTQFTKVHI
jgi:hypothetical protein